MINLFVDPDDEIIVKFAVAVDKDSRVYADVDSESLKSALRKIECEIEDHQAIFKKPSFGDAVDMVGTMYKTNIEGSISINPLEDRYQKMVKLIKSWTMIDAKGNKMPTSEKNIKSLHPVIADIISTQLEIEIGSIFT